MARPPAGPGFAGILSSRGFLYAAVPVMAVVIGYGRWRAVRTME